MVGIVGTRPSVQHVMMQSWRDADDVELCTDTVHPTSLRDADDILGQTQSELKLYLIKKDRQKRNNNNW